MSTTPEWGRYTELLPIQQQQLVQKHPIAWLPWATLVARGLHLAQGAAGWIAEAVTERAIRHVGGVLYPVLWRDPGLEIPLFRQLLTARLQSIADQGFQIAVVVGFPDNAEVDLMLMETAEAMLRQHHLLTLAVSPLELVDTTMQDRGALWETSLLLAIRPTLVNLHQLDTNDERNVRDLASPSLGQQVLVLAGERLATAVHDLYTRQNVAAVTALYQQRRVQYQRSIP